MNNWFKKVSSQFTKSAAMHNNASLSGAAAASNQSQLSSQQLANPIGSAGGSGNLGTFTVPMGGTYHTQWQSTYKLRSLTPEEERRMHELQSEYKEQCRTHHLNAFKKLDSNLRQTVINMFLWNDFLSSQRILPQKSQELVQLEQMNLVMLPQDMAYRYDMSASLPNGITVEDLVMAHAEASLEEEVL